MNIVETVLELENVTMQFGGVVAVDSFSMHVDQGETVALIGPNGAGKTTAFNCHHRRVRAHQRLTSSCAARSLRRVIPPAKCASSTPARTSASTTTSSPTRLIKSPRWAWRAPSRTSVCSRHMSVLENVLVARHMRLKAGLFASMLHVNQQEERRIRQESLDLLDMLGLGDVAQEKASSLPYGKQRYLEIARALATEPRLLLLDEPAAGMNPQETDELSDFIRKIKEDFKLTVFLIEHHMNLVMDISDRIYVLDFGKLISEGTPQQVQDDPAVIAAYLGVDEE